MRARLPAPPSPPVARQIDHEDVVHGDRRPDPYRWLRDRSNPEVRAYLEAENGYADELLQPTDGLRQTLYDEMLARIQQTDLTVPYRDRGCYYYSRTEEGKQYPIYCRKAGSLEAPEEVLLDGNVLAEGRAFFALGTATVSDDGRLLAFSTDFSGNRQYTLRVRALDTGLDREETRANVTSAAWSADDRTLFYTVEDKAQRSYRLYRWAPGQADDVLVYEETDERFSVYVERTRSQRFLVLDVASHTTSEVHLLDAAAPLGDWRLVAPRRQDIEYDVEHHGDHLYIRVNDTGRHFRLVKAALSNLDPSAWEEVRPHRHEVMLEGVLAFREHLVLFERERGLAHLTIRGFGSTTSHRIQFPEPVYSAFPSTNREFDTHLFRYSYQSFITPSSIYDYDMRARTSTLLKRRVVLGGYDPARYRSERIEAVAPDGVRVPVSLLMHRDTPRDGTAAMLLTGYGAYGISSPVTFSSNVFSLVDRGVVYAIAHVRGGGDLGKSWHDDGRMLRKKNSFVDFIAVADHLVAGGYAARDRLVVAGGSAGGLLVAAALNMRPDLCHAAILWVPFVDVVNTMLDASLPLTVGEYEEWGNPLAREEYEYIKSYCPYSNLRQARYPAMLVRTSLHDSQVMFWEPAKYVARLRTLERGDCPLLLVTNLAAGHGGASGRYDRLRETALDYAFVLWQVDGWRATSRPTAAAARPPGSDPDRLPA
jgi:oligopeptidase B